MFIHSFIPIDPHAPLSSPPPPNTHHAGSQSNLFDVFLFVFIPVKHAWCACVFHLPKWHCAVGFILLLFSSCTVILRSTHAVMPTSRFSLVCPSWFTQIYLGADTRGPQCAATTDCVVLSVLMWAQVEFLCSGLPLAAFPIRTIM